MATSTQQNSRGNTDEGGKRLGFKKVDFDNKVLEPDAAVGKYAATIAAVIPRASKDGWPQLKVQVRLDEADDQDDAGCVKSEGATLDDYWTFSGDNRRGANFTKRKIRSAADACEVDIDELPTMIATEEDLKQYATVFKGKKCTVWVVSEKDRTTGEEQARLQFSEPRAPNVPMLEEEEEEEAPAPRAGKKAAASKSRR